jgi:hypothetical protein
MSLRWRLALLFALGTAAVVAVAGLAFVWQLRASLNAAQDGALQARAQALAARVATARPLVLHGQGSRSQIGGNQGGGDQGGGDQGGGATGSSRVQMSSCRFSRPVAVCWTTHRLRAETRC